MTSDSFLAQTKKTKRKPWDLRGQVEDLKDALAEEKKKADVVDDILMRLKVMSWLVTDADVPMPISDGNHLQLILVPRN